MCIRDRVSTQSTGAAFAVLSRRALLEARCPMAMLLRRLPGIASRGARGARGQMPCFHQNALLVSYQLQSRTLHISQHLPLHESLQLSREQSDAVVTLAQPITEVLEDEVDVRTGVLGKLFNISRRVLMYFLLGTPILVFGVPLWLLSKTPLGGLGARLSWGYLVWSMEVLGPTFIKYGQWASTRRDLFPALLIEKLERLQDNTSIHSWATTVGLVREALGEGWEDRVRLDKTPIGSGCVAQVYKGALVGEDGAETEVAVKLLHPGVQEVIEADMALMKCAARWLETIPKLHYLSILDTIVQFEEVMLLQLDLRHEARNLDMFNSNFAEETSTSVRFPRPIRELVRRNMLVETFEHGVPMSQMFDHPNEDFKKQLCAYGSAMVLKMIFTDRFVHADLHPGNVLVDARDPEDVQLVVLDAGLVTEVDKREGSAMVEIAIKMLRHQGYAAGEMMLDHAKVQDCDNSFAFCKGVEYIVDHSFDDTDDYASFGTYLMQVCGLACTHRVKVCLLYTSPSPRDRTRSRMPSSA
eukprot:TRINITY_DN16333_c0_g1_i2.p1 TRINITY_DN16333_c0_g1~~TRINITY_DN16333_c0_g1_i2.p1  ORF type:complete len:541 (+),score=139.23 TRINITY_DN16333_c0_g1_i2:45-1625(+)